MATKPLTQTTGRRKEAVARARLRPGTGVHTINGKAFDAYFTTAMQRMTVTEALRVTETETSYDIDATMHGGGISGQAGAVRHGIARSLVELDPEARASLKKAPAHSRPTSQGEQEVRPQEGP
jgi:small subunit ribosomal protein S9